MCIRDREALTVSHFQKAVLKIGNYLIILAVALVAVIIGFAIYRGDKILETLQFALVLTVAAIPVAMPTVLSVTMAVGARLLAKKQAIVKMCIRDRSHNETAATNPPTKKSQDGKMLVPDLNRIKGLKNADSLK